MNTPATMWSRTLTLLAPLRLVTHAPKPKRWSRYRRDELIALLRASVAVLATRLPLKTVTLFGSQATGRATAFSDVDVLVIYAGPAPSDAYELVRRTLAIRGLEPHVYTEDEASLLGPVVERMMRGGIELYLVPKDGGLVPREGVEPT